MRILLIRHNTDGTLDWDDDTYDDDDWTDILRGHLNAPGVVKVEVIPG